MRFLAVVLFVSGLLALNGAHSSRKWQQFKNSHGCEMIARSGATPRSYICSGQPCSGPRECRSTIKE